MVEWSATLIAAGETHASHGAPCEDLVLVTTTGAGVRLAIAGDGHGADAVRLVDAAQTVLHARIETLAALDAALLPLALLHAVRDEAVHAAGAAAIESGLTLTVCAWTAGDGVLHTAHVGDSQAMLLHAHATDAGDWTLTSVTPPHRLSNAAERARARLPADVDATYVVHPDDAGSDWPRVLGVTRVLGDLSFDTARTGVLREAETAAVPLTAVDGRLRFLVVASDGLWDLVGEPAALCETWRALTPTTAPGRDLTPQLLLDSLRAAVDELGGHDDDLAVAVCSLV